MSKAGAAKTLLIGQFIATAVLCICTALGVKVSEYAAGCIIGLLNVQVLLAAVWLVMAPFSLLFRIFSSTAAVIFLVACFYRVAWRDGGGHGIAITVSTPLLILWVLIQIPLWLARMKGWRVGRPNSLEQVERTEFQFGIRQLMIWTAVVAVSVATIKWFVAKIDTSTPTGMGLLDFEFALHLVVGNSLIALPIVWGAFVNRGAAIWFLISFAVCIGVCTIQICFYEIRALDYSMVIIANVVQTVLSMVAMFIVRLLGLRLNRAVP